MDRTRETLIGVMDLVHELEQLRRDVDTYRRFAEQGDPMNETERRLLEEGKHHVFDKGWLRYREDSLVKYGSEEPMNLAEYADACIGDLPAWMSKEQFIKTFAAEITARYDEALEAFEGGEDD